MKVLVSSINFTPDHAGIGLYSSDLPMYLAEQGDSVTMVTGFPYYPQWRKRPEDKGRLFAKEEINGVKVLRGYMYVPSGHFGAVKRLLHELTFVVFAMFNFLRAGRPDVIVIFTPPFFLGILSVIAKWIWRVPLVTNVQDLPIDAAKRLGMVRSGGLLRILQAVESWQYRQADMVTSISPMMIQNLKEKGVSAERLELVPNWIDVKTATQSSPSGQFLNKHQEAQDKFIIAYAGNLGVKQGIDILIRVAKKMENDKSVYFFIIGEGADKDRLVQLAKELEVGSNLSFLPFMSPSEYQAMLADVQVTFVGQKSGAGNNFFPSKLLGLMANGQPLLVAADPECELAKVIREAGCGKVCDYDAIDQIVAAVKELKCMSASELQELGMRGRLAVNTFDRGKVLGDWKKSIEKLVSERLPKIHSSTAVTANKARY